MEMATVTTTSSSSRSADNKMYNEAVYLNNAGCALIEHGAYHLALDTVRDAILVMKASSAVEGHATDSSSSPSNLDIEAMTRRAAQRMASIYTQGSGHAPLPKCSDSSSCINPVSVMTFELSDLSQMEIDDMMTINLEEEMLVCPVRIEVTDCAIGRHAAPPSDEQRDRDSAIMLHNLGLINACLAKYYGDFQQAGGGDEATMETAALRDQLQQAAIQIFSFADATLAPQSANHDRYCNGDDCGDAVQVSKIHMAVLHSLLQVRLQQQLQQLPPHSGNRRNLDSDEVLLDRDCEEILDRLYFLQDFIFMSERFAPFLCAEFLPAPAA